MTAQGCRRMLRAAALAAGLQAVCGCLSFLHPLPAPPPEQLESCLCVPRDGRCHVHIFLIHGFDPCDYANLEGVRDYINALGFNNTYYGQFYHTHTFRKEICRIHREDPDARCVVIGFSRGARGARTLVMDLQEDNRHVDLLVYLDGKSLMYVPPDSPENAGRIVSIIGPGCLWTTPILAGVENIQIKDVWHFGTPTHLGTLETLARELAALAATVPIVQTHKPASPLIEEAPTPRPVTKETTAQRDEWDFLKPVPTLSFSRIEEDASEQAGSAK